MIRSARRKYFPITVLRVGNLFHSNSLTLSAHKERKDMIGRELYRLDEGSSLKYRLNSGDRARCIISLRHSYFPLQIFSKTWLRSYNLTKNNWILRK